MITEQQRVDMRARLGDRVGLWSGKGIDFLCKRTNGSQREISLMIIDCYLSGEISKIPITIRREIAPIFGRNDLIDESIAVILLGRSPAPDTAGRMQEGPTELTDIQDQSASQLVEYVSTLNGARYINRSRR